MNVWCISEYVVELFVDLLSQLIHCLFRDVELTVVTLASWTYNCDVLLTPFIVKSPCSYVGGCVDFRDDYNSVFLTQIDQLLDLIQGIKLPMFKSTGLSKLWMRC